MRPYRNLSNWLKLVNPGLIQSFLLLKSTHKDTETNLQSFQNQLCWNLRKIARKDSIGKTWDMTKGKIRDVTYENKKCNMWTFFSPIFILFTWSLELRLNMSVGSTSSMRGISDNTSLMILLSLHFYKTLCLSSVVTTKLWWTEVLTSKRFEFLNIPVLLVRIKSMFVGFADRKQMVL